jgi:glucokinase
MKKKFIIGVDLGGTNLKIALLDANYKIRDKKILNTSSFNKKESLISAIIASIDLILKDNRVKKSEILGVGLGLPGPVDNKKGIVHFFPNIPGWRKVSLKGILEKNLGLPVYIDNDAKLMCLAESRVGSARGFKNALCLTLGTGIGSGLIINSEIYRGRDNASGEFGHVPLNEKGPRCNCGGIACLEAYIGNKRVLKQVRKLFRRNISLEELSALAKKGNKKAKQVWIDVGRRLGIALAGVVNLLNLDAIVIGGGVANAGSILFSSVREAIKMRAMDVQARRVKIYKAELGSNAGIVGAAIIVAESGKR